MNKNGFFLVSLDFELLWGVHNHETKSTFHNQIEDARKAIPKLLQLFDKYNVHATWATVGLLFADNREEMSAYSPAVKPVYQNELLSSYRYFDDVGQDEKDDMYHYAPSLIKAILEHPGQELASHTFSHYYCRDCNDAEAFRADLESAKRIARDKYGVEVTSLIFPRNQYTEECAKVAAEQGFTAIRGNVNFIYEKKSVFSRLLRLADTYFNVCGMKCYKKDACIKDGFVNLRASRFLRRYNKKLAFLEPLKLSCIKRQMRYAARTGRLFHLWWHPHNLGNNVEEFLAQVEELLVYYTELHKKYGFVSKSLAQAQRDIINENRIAVR